MDLKSNGVMKNLIYILLVLTFGMASCFEDDTTLGTIEVGDIEIGKLSDQTVVLFVGKHLQVSPDVKHGYAEEEMSYTWYLMSEKEADEHNYRAAKQVADTKELDLAVDDHELNLVPGKYTLVFEAKADNSYTQTAAMTLITSTEFSEGFYILKETADGNTELDLITAEKHFSDLMESKVGNALPGKPLSLAVIYDNGRINEEDELESTNMVHVFAERDYHAFRTADMLETFNRGTLMFEPMAEDEVLYGMTSFSNGNICFSNKGYYTFTAGVSSGKVGVPDVDGDVTFVQPVRCGGTDKIFWNNRTNSLWSANDGGELEYTLPAGFEATNLECVASGECFEGTNEIVWFLCKDKTSGRGVLLQGNVVDVMEELFPGFWWPMGTELEISSSAVSADKHLAKSDLVSAVGLGRKGIYVVDEGKIYVHDIATGEEILIPLEGIEGEITYISNNYLNLYDPMGNTLDGCFNYLLIATRHGDGYHLYFFDDLVAGVPRETTPKEVKSGENGVVRGVRYCSNAVSLSILKQINPNFYRGPVYPYGD